MMINYWHFDWIGRAWKRETLVTNDAAMCRYAYPYSHHPNREVCNKNLFLCLQRDFIRLLLFDWHGWMSYWANGKKRRFVVFCAKQMSLERRRQFIDRKKICNEAELFARLLPFPIIVAHAWWVSKKRNNKRSSAISRERERKNIQKIFVSIFLYLGR